MTGYLNVVGCGDSFDYLRQVPDNSIDACTTDPPYGLGEPPPVAAVMLAWARGKEYVPKNKVGFMGKDWDAFVPGPALWREVYRVLKPGAYCLVFAGTRTQDWMGMSLRFAGFDVTDCVYWHYAVGFPKSLNISKAIDSYLTTGKSNSKALQHTNDEVRTEGERWRGDNNRQRGGGIVGGERVEERIIRDGAATEEGKAWAGWGSALKPATEPVIVARKPFEGTYAENVLEWGCGGLNIDACRVGGQFCSQEEWNKKGSTGSCPEHVKQINQGLKDAYAMGKVCAPQGRWPANLAFSHHPDCVPRGSKQIKVTGKRPAGGKRGSESAYAQDDYSQTYERTEHGGFTDADGNETVISWDCHDDCPVKMLDEQSGELHPRGNVNPTKTGKSAWFTTTAGETPSREKDYGGASRFFYSGKAAQSERWAFCKKCNQVYQRKATDDHADHRDDVISHPTQKPLDLMKWLVNLVTPPGGVVLDPFCGTGTTGVAAKTGGFNFVTCDLSPEYAKIANSRLSLVGVTTPTASSGAYFCPGCKAKGEIKLIPKDAVNRMKEEGKKVTCPKCLKRYTFDDLTSS